MPSFDVVSEVDLQEVDNAINSMKRELTTRFDFKGSNCSVEREENVITMLADDGTKHKSMTEMIKGYFAKRNLDAKALEFGTAESASGNSIRQRITIKQGINQDIGKKINKEIKASKIKVQSSIRGEELRVTGKKRDDLQQVMQLLREMPLDIPLQFSNFRD